MKILKHNFYMTPIFIIVFILIILSACTKNTELHSTNEHTSTTVKSSTPSKVENTNNKTQQPNTTNISQVSNNVETQQIQSIKAPAIGKRITAPQTSLTSPMEINILDEISGEINNWGSERVNCYSFKIKEKTQFNIYIKLISGDFPISFLFKSDIYKTLQKDSNLILKPFIESSNSIMRRNKSNNVSEWCQIYKLDPGEYYICIYSDTGLRVPLKYEFVTFLGDDSKNPWLGDYVITADRAAGFGFMNSSETKNNGQSNMNSSGIKNNERSNKSNLLTDWRREEMDRENREREARRQRDNHPNLKKR